MVLQETAKSARMQTPAAESSDGGILKLLRKHDAMTVSQLASATGVTATAVRQRLGRLMGKQFVDRTLVRSGRGRPSHHYRLSEQGRRQTGANFADLAIALWQEIRSIKDAELRRGLLKRLANSMAGMYRDRIQGDSPQERLESIGQLFAERDVPFSVHEADQLPVLTAEACPYPQLAEQDRGVCAMEKMLFSELAGVDLRLTECRLDGAGCCTFETA